MSSLREVQLYGVKILDAVDELCRKHNLTYHLNYGTLLGAVRHQGFIPWDNDIDISMPISDYRKFIRIAQKELPEEYFVQTYWTDRGYNEMWAKIRANGTTSLPVAWKDYAIHLGIGIDIFPMVGWAKSARVKKAQIRAYGLCRTLLAKEFMLAIGSREINVSRKLRMLLALPWHLRVFLCKFLESIAFQNIRQDGTVAIAATGLRKDVSAEKYGTGNTLLFEGKSYPVPNDWDYVLSEFYGDYMTPPPPEKRENDHESKLGRIIYDCEKDYREYLKELAHEN